MDLLRKLMRYIRQYNRNAKPERCTMVLCTRFDTGSVQVFDFMVLTDENTTHPHRQLVRLVEGLEGEVELAVEVQPRFGFGDIKPWLRQHDADVFAAIGVSLPVN